MENENLLLGDVARLLRVKPYRVTYALTTGLVPEPRNRIANKRLFGSEDVARLAAHFRTTIGTAADADLGLQQETETQRTIQ